MAPLYLYTANIANAGRPYDPSKPSNPVEFDESLVQRQGQGPLKSFNDLLDEATSREEKQKLQDAIVAFETADAELVAAIAAGGDVDQAKKKKSAKWVAKNRVAMAIRKKEAAVYLTMCKKAGVSLEATKAIEILCNMHVSEKAKPPTLEQLDSLGDIVSEVTKADFTVFIDKKTAYTCKKKKKYAFKYHLCVDVATALEKSVKNKHGKALVAKLWDDADNKYFWGTAKGDSISDTSRISGDGGRAFSQQWFLPSVLGKVAKAFCQLEIVDSVEENNEKANKIRDLLGKVERSEGNEREKFIQQFWETT